MMHKYQNNKFISFIIFYIQYRRQRKLQKKYNDIIVSFFNLDKPCPLQVCNCEQLRIDFLAELDKYKKFNMCMTCDVLNIKQHFIRKIIQNII